jgi:hypothetical protein
MNSTVVNVPMAYAQSSTSASHALNFVSLQPSIQFTLLPGDKRQLSDFKQPWSCFELNCEDNNAECVMGDNGVPQCQQRERRNINDVCKLFIQLISNIYCNKTRILSATSRESTVEGNCERTLFTNTMPAEFDVSRHQQSSSVLS